MSDQNDSINGSIKKQKKSKKPPLSTIDQYILAIENKQAYTSFGALPLSE